VEQWAAVQPPEAWQRLTLREGEKGLRVAEYSHARVWVWDGQEENARCWHLLVRREVGAQAISHYCLSNAPLGCLASSYGLGDARNLVSGQTEKGGTPTVAHAVI